MLNWIELNGVGPAKHARLDFAPRYNILTGDNGVGKSFFLDIAWWALTRTWADGPALPPHDSENATISHEYSVHETSPPFSSQIHFQSKWKRDFEEWSEGTSKPLGIVIYAQPNSSIAVWDSWRNRHWRQQRLPVPLRSPQPPAFFFTPNDVLEGLRDETAVHCNGLINDWVRWQDRQSSEFKLLEEVLKQLSPHEDELIRPGQSKRLYARDARDIPHIRLPYGETPVTHVSSAMKRILSLAYIMVWAHHENLAMAKESGNPPASQYYILLDEIESHLHPQWQRVILPALHAAIELLTAGSPDGGSGEKPTIQIIATTHAPLVLGSLDTTYDPVKDRVHVLSPNGEDIKIEQLDWHKREDATSWLTSEAFGLQSARSLDAEEVVREASAFLNNGKDNAQHAMEIDGRLRETLGETDSFWIRWRFVGEKQGWLAK